MPALALIDSVTTEGGRDPTIPAGERSSMRAEEGSPEMMTVSRVDERERELCRWRKGRREDPSSSSDKLLREAREF